VSSTYVIGASNNEAADTIVPRFTAEQVQRILSLIKTTKDGHKNLSSKGEWLFDTGASCHVTRKYEYLDNVRSIDSIVVGLPNGRQALVNKISNVDLGPHLKLKDVLFVYKLTCNLISIYQLAKDSNCVVTFTDSFCGIPDRISKTLIGLCNVQGGVFLHKMVLEAKKQAHAVQTSESREVLTCKEFRFYDRVANKANETCDVCLCAKQTRSPFSQSESNASELFELIHCDIWGAYRVRSSCSAHYFLTIVDDHS